MGLREDWGPAAVGRAEATDATPVPSKYANVREYQLDTEARDLHPLVGPRPERRQHCTEILT